MHIALLIFYLLFLQIDNMFVTQLHLLDILYPLADPDIIPA